MATAKAEAISLVVEGTGTLRDGNGFYLVPSASDPDKFYVVEQHPTHLSCTCKDHYYRNRRCKHIQTVVEHKQRLQREQADATFAMLEQTTRELAETNRKSAAASERQSMTNRTRGFSLLK